MMNNDSKKVLRSMYLLLGIGGIYTLSVSLSNTFVNIYLWKQTNNFIDIACYNMTIYIFQAITFYFSGKLATRVDRVISLRIGVMVLSIFYICVLITGNNTGKYYLLLGAILGIGYGFYWLSFNLLTFEITEPETRDFFNSFLGSMTSLAGMIGPPTAGFIISRMQGDIGYKLIFFLSLFLFLCAVILSFLLLKREKVGSYMVFTILNERKINLNWKRITRAHFFQGIREGTFLFVISIYIFIVTNDEFALGTYGLVNSLISFVMYVLTVKFSKKFERKNLILCGGLLLLLSVFLIVFNVTYTKFIMYAICISIAYPILLAPYNSLTYDVIGQAQRAREHRIEYIVVREWFLNAGRILSVICFIITILIWPAEKSIPIFLVVAGAGHLLIYLNIKNI